MEELRSERNGIRGHSNWKISFRQQLVGIRLSADIIQILLGLHHGKTSTPPFYVGGRPLCNQRFADEINLMARTNSRSARRYQQTDSVNEYGSTDKSKVMANTKAEIYLNEVQLEEVNGFKYL